MTTPLRVALVAEQLLEPDPGPIGAYVRGLLRHLPSTGVAVEPVVAMHRTGALSDAGVPHATRLRHTRSSLYHRWSEGRPPKPSGEAQLVHAPNLVFPPADGRPLVVTVHDTLFLEQPDDFPPPALDFNLSMVRRLEEVDTVIVPSRVTGNVLAGLDSPPRRIRVVPLGTDVAPPADASEAEEMLERLQVKRPYVLWTGTLEPRRNPEGVVRGFVEALASSVPDADELSLYMVCPSGWWSSDVAELLEATKLTDRVRRIDPQPAAVRGALYANAAAFLYPSLSESFGVPIIEAMACGAPVVTSNTSALPEVAGSAAQLCDPTDPSSIGQALAAVLRDRDLAADLRRLGIRRAQEFTWERTARETLSCYQEALATRAGT